MRFNDETADSYYRKAKEWAEADGEARMMEKMEKIILSEIVNRCEGSVAKAEHEARASTRYKEHCTSMIQARTRATVLKAELQAMELAHERWRTVNATRRAEMKIL